MADTVAQVLETHLTITGVSGFLGGMNQATGSVGKFQTAVSAATGLIAGIGGIAASFRFVNDAVKAAAESQAGYSRDARNFKGAFPLSELEDWANALQDQTAIDDDVIAGLAGIAGSFQLTKDQAKGLVESALNAGESLKALGVSREQLVNAGAKAAVAGDATNLRRMGVVIDDVSFKSKTFAERLKAVDDAFNAQGGSGAAAAWAQTTEGRMSALHEAVNDLQKDFGLLGTEIAGSVAGTAKKAIDTFLGLPAPLKSTAYLVGVAIPVGLGLLSLASSLAAIRQAKLTGALVDEVIQLNAATKAANNLANAQGRLGGGGAGGKGVSGFSGKAGAVVAATDFALQFLPDNALGGSGRAIKNIANFASAGATIGSFIPGLGTAVGAGIGGGIGALGNITGLLPTSPQKDEAAEALKQVAANTAKIAENTDPNKQALATSVLPAARQIGGLAALQQQLT